MRLCWLFTLCASIAHADPVELPTIESEHPPTLGVSTDDWGTRIERVAVAIRSAPETSWVTISLGGRADRVVNLWLDLPFGTRVFGLGIAEERGSVWGRPMLSDQVQRGGVFNGVLSWSGTSAAQDHYRISVETPSTIEIALQLPPLARLAIDANAGVVSVDVDGDQRLIAKRARRREVIDLGDVVGMTGACGNCASERVSIVAAKAHTTDFFEPVVHRAFQPRDIDKAMIRRRMKRHRPQLRQCYMQVAQWNPSVKGGVILSFMIDASGTVAWAVATESDLPTAVSDCLINNVLRWEFPAADGNVQVNYPLEFRLIE